jgi:hypothetical protein
MTNYLFYFSIICGDFMKKVLLFAVALLVAGSMSVMAQGPFNKDTGVLNAGIGFGSFLSGDEVLPPITLSYEVGWPSNDGIFEKMSVGGTVGFGTSEYNWFYSDCTLNYTHIILGARGSYHFYNKGKFDAYAGLMLGYNIVSSEWDCDFDGEYDASSSSFTYSAYLGARYYFTPKIGAFAEIGYGIAWLNVGLAVKI